MIFDHQRDQKFKNITPDKTIEESKRMCEIMKINIV